MGEKRNLGFPIKIHDRVNDADNWALRSQLLLDVPLDTSAMEWLLNVGGPRRGAEHPGRVLPGPVVRRTDVAMRFVPDADGPARTYGVTTSIRF